jgi:hypothetical protein
MLGLPAAPVAFAGLTMIWASLVIMGRRLQIAPLFVDAFIGNALYLAVRILTVCMVHREWEPLKRWLPVGLFLVLALSTPHNEGSDLDLAHRWDQSVLRGLILGVLAPMVASSLLLRHTQGRPGVFHSPDADVHSPTKDVLPLTMPPMELGGLDIEQLDGLSPSLRPPGVSEDSTPPPTANNIPIRAAVCFAVVYLLFTVVPGSGLHRSPVPLDAAAGVASQVLLVLPALGSVMAVVLYQRIRPSCGGAESPLPRDESAHLAAFLLAASCIDGVPGLLLSLLQAADAADQGGLVRLLVICAFQIVTSIGHYFVQLMADGMTTPFVSARFLFLFVAFDDLFKSLVFVTTSKGWVFFAQLVIQCFTTVLRGAGCYGDLWAEVLWSGVVEGEGVQEREARIKRQLQTASADLVTKITSTTVVPVLLVFDFYLPNPQLSLNLSSSGQLLSLVSSYFIILLCRMGCHVVVQAVFNLKVAVLLDDAGSAAFSGPTNRPPLSIDSGSFRQHSFSTALTRTDSGSHWLDFNRRFHLTVGASLYYVCILAFATHVCIGSIRATHLHKTQ